MFKITNSTNLVQELFSKTDPTRFQGNNLNSAKNKNLLTFLGAQKSKEQREALETPNKLCKTFRDAIETLSNSDCNFSNSNFDYLTKERQIRTSMTSFLICAHI
jgi:hypothetical protein